MFGAESFLHNKVEGATTELLEEGKGRAALGTEGVGLVQDRRDLPLLLQRSHRNYDPTRSE